MFLRIAANALRPRPRRLAFGERSAGKRDSPMRYRAQPVTEEAAADPYSQSSLGPMLIAGLVLTTVGMIVALLVT
jgi:hypothetical protein